MDRKWWTLIAVCVGTFMLLIDVTIVNVALPDIQTSLKSSFSDVQWVVDAYSLMLAALLLTTGSLADLFGRRRIFVAGLVVFTASSLLSGLATTPLFLNLARGAQGVGGAAMFSTSLALLASSFRGRERGVAFGVWGAITGLAVAVGPVVGGALTTGLSWRWIFLVNVPIGIVAVALTLLRVEESRQPGAHRPDWIGAITFSGALAALVYALIQGNTKGWSSTEIEACLGGSAALLLIFLGAERLQKAPMFDLSLFRKPTFAGGSIVAFALSAGMFSLLLYLTLYLQDVLGFSALDTGLRLLVISGGILLTSTLAGRLTTRVPISLLIGPGLVLVGVGVLLMRGLTAASGWQHFIPGFIVAGAGVGIINPPLASTAVGVVEPARAGMASGINSTCRQVGIATGIAGLGAVFSHTVRTKVLGVLSAAGGLSTAQAHAVASGVAQGTGAGAAISAAPPYARLTAIHAVRVGFVDGLNQVFLIGAIVSLSAAALAFVLIRNKDFEASAAHLGGGAPPAPDPLGAPPAPDPQGAPAPDPQVAAVAPDPERAQTAATQWPAPAEEEPAKPAALAAAAAASAQASWGAASAQTGPAVASAPTAPAAPAPPGPAGPAPPGPAASTEPGPAATWTRTAPGPAPAQPGPAAATPPAAGAGGGPAQAGPGATPAQPVPGASPAQAGPGASPAPPGPAATPAPAGPAAAPAQAGPGASPAPPGPAATPAQAGPGAAAAQPGPAATPAQPGPAAAPAQPGPAAAPAQPGPAAALAQAGPGAAPAPPGPAAGPAQPSPGARPLEPSPGNTRAQPGPGAAPAQAGPGPTPAVGGPRPGSPTVPASGTGAAPATPAPGGIGRSYAVALAAEQAAVDCATQIESIIARERAAAGASPVGPDVGAGASRRAAVLQGRLNELGDERRRLVGSLREHTQAIADHLQAADEHTRMAQRADAEAAGTRRRLYGLIAALAALADEASDSGARPGPAQPAAANGENPVRTAISRLPD